ncbi:MAG TPA: MBL fold metallo-hydrolase, partial [Thermomicrobiales bacterium]|nr:MBL fold metallo-hydrolase [Thermomicrobiales bacterium]
VTLIDSGLNDTTARKVLRVVRDDLRSEVVSIINTHGHADHFGANAFLYRRSRCEFWAPTIEAAVIANPILQPVLLFGGADPLDALRNKFLLAESAPVTGEIPIGTWEHRGTQIEVVPLPGHSPNQVGFLIDGAFFVADVVFPSVAIEKYRIPYLFGLTDQLASLESVGNIAASRIIPGHGEAPESIDGLRGINLEAINRTIEALLELLSEPLSGDTLAGMVFARLEVPVTDAQSYFLLRPTISAYLAHLERIDAITFEVTGGTSTWRRT